LETYVTELTINLPLTRLNAGVKLSQKKRPTPDLAGLGEALKRIGWVKCVPNLSFILASQEKQANKNYKPLPFRADLERFF
jgi:hypothetical protein